mgnify:CR=1 FL=1|jgi:hypothetical protein
MIVIESNFVTQRIYLIPRYYEDNISNVIKLTNIDNKEITFPNIAIQVSQDGYNIYKFDIENLSEGMGFDIVVFRSATDDTVIYRGKIFATAQETQKYKINEQ